MAAPLIVITGATHGMGRALAIAFARDLQGSHPCSSCAVICIRDLVVMPTTSGY